MIESGPKGEFSGVGRNIASFEMNIVQQPQSLKEWSQGTRKAHLLY